MQISARFHWNLKAMSVESHRIFI